MTYTKNTTHHKIKFNYGSIDNTMQQVANISGYVFAPIILRPLFKSFLDKYLPSKMNIDKARTLTDVFLCLCNEQRIYGDIDNGEFFVQRDKWQDEYCIGIKAFENSIKILKSMKLITYTNKWDKRAQTKRRWFKIDRSQTHLLIDRANIMKKILDKRKANKVKVDNHWL